MKFLPAAALVVLKRPFHLLAALFLLASCEKKETPSAASTLPLLEEVAATTDESATQEDEISADVDDSGKPSRKKSKSALRFIAYNVENWLILENRFDFETKINSKDAPKPEKEKAAVVEILVKGKPDVLGLCEIGGNDDLLEIQKLLKAAGLDLPHHHLCSGIDTTRHLGLLSKFPIVSTAIPAATSYKLDGKEFSIQRGILDATVETPDQRRWRFLGVHFKSKREVQGMDQEQMRINEAVLMRKHIDSIFQQDPTANLIAYGDFNDTRGSSTMRIVYGPRNSPRSMHPIALRDSHGLYWTHFWAKEDVYARIDYILFSPSLKSNVIFDDCKILDPKNWNEASDHRATLGVFR
jgi:endonuclease/exonuclease/phosphatase family metal-dependent hydrolase